MLWVLVLVTAVIGAAQYWWSRRKIYKLKAEVPGLPNSNLIFGQGLGFIGNSEDRMKHLQEMGKWTNEYGGLASAWLGNRLFICLTDPPSIEVVSKTCLAKDEFTLRFFRTAIGNGSIFAPVNIWHPRRKINSPFYSLKNLNKIVPQFHTQSIIMVDLMRAELGKGDFSIWKYVTTYTFDAVGESAIGFKLNSQGNPDHYLLQAIDEGTHMVAKRALQPWLHPDVVYKNLPVYKQFQKHLEGAYAFLDKVIKSKRLEVKENKNNRKTDRTNFLEVLIESSGGIHNGYSEVELREEIMVMMVAGNDTSATAVCFAAVLLSRYPEVQEKVLQELREVFGDSDREVTAEDLPRLKYLEAVFKESLRLYPPVPVVAREVHSDVVLPSGTTLVDGTSVMINIWGLHRSAAWWGADADQFRPERFWRPSSDTKRCSCPSATLLGIRIKTHCQAYAMLSSKTALANLLRRYRLLPPEGARDADLQRPLPVKYDIMMKANDGFAVRIEERSPSAT
ncbi:cytochrome P450 4C1-like [Leguminivora glycinivorella]|uniref:cytochrome P450 4C1-like n=1 Tax=Leguminivora glycinivorella TaxID=1035111 RepID=UPI00200CB0EE|nr:cytochrome P450 4C1-like [Leguminivora glycinivorella]